MTVIPRVADVHCQRFTFRPGDRVLVRCCHRLEPMEERRLRRSVKRWAGAAVEVLIYNPFDVEIKLEQR